MKKKSKRGEMKAVYGAPREKNSIEGKRERKADI